MTTKKRKVRAMRTVQTRLRKIDIRVLVAALCAHHWTLCPTGCMICKCDLAVLIREFAKLSDRKRIGEAS